MDAEVKAKELKFIHGVYKDSFDTLELRLNNSLLNSLNDEIFASQTSHLRVKTGEGAVKKVTVDIQGWYVIGTNQYYETFETLMMHISQHFADSFANQLSAKLNTLSNVH